MSLNACWQFGDSLLLSSNDRICISYWIRGSKHCFLTSFSHLNHYFLFLVFLCNHYLLVSLCLSWLHRNPISRPIFSYLWYSEVLCCMCAPIFLAHMTCFLEARCLQEPGIRISTGFLSLFRLLPKVSHANVHWAIANHTFSSHITTLNWYFLSWHKPLLSQRSTARARNLKGFPNLWIKVDCCLSDDASGRFPKRSWHLFAFQWVPCTSFNSIVWPFLATKSFEAGSSTDPCHLACVLKSVPRYVTSLIGCITQLPRSSVGVMRVSQGWLLNVPFLQSSWSSGFLRLLLMTMRQSECSCPPVMGGVTVKHALTSTSSPPQWHPLHTLEPSSTTPPDPPLGAC